MACYVISNDAHIASNEYKFGYTDNTNKEKLLKRYNTQLNNPKILLFYYTPNAKDDETSILVYFKDFRCKNAKGNYNEWLKIDFEVLKEYLDKYFAKEEYADFRKMNLKQIELKVETLRLKVAETQLKTANKEWKILVSKAIKDEEYLLELLNLHAKPDNAIDLDYYYEKYKVLNEIKSMLWSIITTTKYNGAFSDSENEDLEKKDIDSPYDKRKKEKALNLLKSNWICEENIKLNNECKDKIIEVLSKKITGKEKIFYEVIKLVKDHIYCYKSKFGYIHFKNKWEICKYDVNFRIILFGIILNNIFTKENIYNHATIEVIIELYKWYFCYNRNIDFCDKTKCINLLLKE